MKVIFSDAHAFEKKVFDSLNAKFKFEFEYLDFRLTSQTAKALTSADVVCSFVSDKLDRDCLKILREKGVQLLALRSAGFNHVDVKAANEFGIAVCRVPSYSPYAVAEYTIGLILSINRKIHRAYSRVREMNFSLEGLVGFDLHGKTIGVIGAGKIGKIVATVMAAFGCEVLISDIFVDRELESNPKVKYVDRETLVSRADIISLHVPLTPETFHLINSNLIRKMKDGVLLVNTGRGALIETKALIAGLKSGKVGGAALDVYEEEEGVFFHDCSNIMLNDDLLARLITFPNVLITSHQAFLTHEALTNIATTTLENIRMFRETRTLEPVNLVAPPVS